MKKFLALALVAGILGIGGLGCSKETTKAAGTTRATTTSETTKGTPSRS